MREQAGKKEGRQARTRKAFSRSHALEGLVLYNLLVGFIHLTIICHLLTTSMYVLFNKIISNKLLFLTVCNRLLFF